MNACLASLRKRPPELTIDVLSVATQVSDDPHVVSALSAPEVIIELMKKARYTPKTDAELTDVLLSQQVILAASKSQIFLGGLVNVDSSELSSLLEYIIQALLRLSSPENKMYTVFISMLINLSRSPEILKQLLVIPGLQTLLDNILTIIFEYGQNQTAPIIQYIVYLVLNITTLTREAPLIANLLLDFFDSHHIGDHIINSAVSRPELAIQYTQVLLNLFLMLRPTDNGQSCAIDPFTPLINHILVVLTCDRCLQTKKELCSPGLTTEELESLPSLVKRHVASSSTLPTLDVTIYSNLSDCLLLYCHAENGKQGLQKLGAYPLLRELHLKTIELYGDKSYLADSLLTVIEGILADSHLDDVN